MIEAKAWFTEFSRFNKQRSLARVRKMLGSETIDLQDSEGLTATHHTVCLDWMAALVTLLDATPNPNLELRSYRTGDTPLYTAVIDGKPHLIATLLEAGADPDAANHLGGTPRQAAAAGFGHAELFARYPEREITYPEPHIQNAEDLADHYHPQFKIPAREEREQLVVGQAVDLHVLGHRHPKRPRVKVRITERQTVGDRIRYVGHVETPENNLPPGTETVPFGPEHVATVWLKRPS